MNDKQPRIALLIDADNAPAEMIDEILTELSTFGVIDIRRAYGNWTKHSLSFGMAQTPQPFVNACSRFLYLEALGEAAPANGNGQDAVHEAGQAAVPPVASTAAAAAAPQPPNAGAREHAPAQAEHEPALSVDAQRPCLRVPTQELRQDTRLLSMLRSAVNATQDESGWAHVGAVGAQIGNKASFDARNYGYATLTKLLAATQAFEMRDEGTSRVAVRDKRAARAQPRPSGN
jgi:uncharacterized LabA/DUF88 family protein